MSKSYDEEQLKQTATLGAQQFTEEDLKKLSSDKDVAFEKAGKLKQLKEKIVLIWNLLMDYMHGSYRDISWTTIASLGFAIAYLVSPLDLIPDFIPILGLTDDAALLAMFIASFNKDLEKYRQWKIMNA